MAAIFRRVWPGIGWKVSIVRHFSEKFNQSIDLICENYDAFAKPLLRPMRQGWCAGEKRFIDFAVPAIESCCGERAHPLAHSAVVPGSAFGDPFGFQISYRLEEQALEAGLVKIHDFLNTIR
jgi:hypothetical protein